MQDVDSSEAVTDGAVRYRLDDGRMVYFDVKAVQEHGIAALMRQAAAGDQIPAERLPVYQDGRRVGTMATDFDPGNVRSRSDFYAPCPGDFRREGDRWIADRKLWPGDLEAVPGFVWAQEEKVAAEGPLDGRGR